MAIEWFPSNIAVGQAFCNRDQERKLLKSYVQNGRHTVLVAPRRYGKTSLINQVLLEIKLPHCMIELTMATSIKEVESMIMKQVSQLLYLILPRTTKAKQRIINLFKWLNPELILTVGGQKIIFHPDRGQRPTTENIAEMLKKLDNAASLLGKRVVVVMDEFQQLTEMEDHAIEASIRHAMQYSKQVSYIFSGSNRHMLLSMFNKKNRPFYNSCEMLVLERISEQAYRPFIQRAAESTWKKKLPEGVLDMIFSLSRLHPSYLNRICGHFWLIHEFPTRESLEYDWLDFVLSKRSEFTEEIFSLSHNQRKMLAYFARFPTQQPGSQTVCQAVGLSEASIRQAVRKLCLKDFLYKDKEGVLRVLDPALQDFIATF